MSLQVWLPLNGNLENIGCSDVVVSNNGATVDNSGKIGKCYYFDGNDDYVEIAGISQYLTGNAPFSICFWIKHLENGTCAVLFSSYGTPSTSKYFALELNSGSVTNNTLRVNYNGVDIDYGGVVDKEKWVHVTVTYDNSKIYKYIDGVLKKTIDYTLPTITETQLFRLGRDSRTGTTALKGYLNDFRFYDHCLSPKEVHEIAQGLVLHYPLNNIYNTGLRNLYQDYINGYATNSSFKRTAGDGFTNYTYTYTGNGSNSYPTASFLPFSFTVGKRYWLHYKIRINSANCNFYMRFARMSNDLERTVGKYNGTYVNKGWMEYNGYQSFSATSSKKGTSYTTSPRVEIYTENFNVSGKVYSFDFDLKDLCIVEYEGKDSPGFIDNSFISSEVTDCSGYGNDGTIYGTPTIETNSPVHNSCFNFSNSGYISCNNFNVSTQACTISLWVNFKVATKQHFLIGTFDSWTGNGIGFYRDANSINLINLFRVSSESTYKIIEMNNLYVGNWFMITCVYTGTEIIFYKNGENFNSTSYGNNGVINNPVFMIANSKFNGTPSSENEEAYISDVRFYSTDLSAEDVKALYQQGASIDNLGSMHTYGEFNEGQEKISIGKNKVVSEGSVNEEGNKTSFHSDSTLITKEINEE